MNERAQQCFDELRQTRAHPAVVDWLQHTVDEADDHHCHQIKPLRVGRELGIADTDVVCAFLFATRLGIVDMRFDIHCPSCLGQPAFHRHLMGLPDRSHCPLCALDVTLSLEEQVEVSFTVNPDVRPIDPDRWTEQSWPADRDHFFQRLTRDERLPAMGMAFETADTTAEARLPPGDYQLQVPGFHEQRLPVTVAGEPTEDVQACRVAIDPEGRFDRDHLRLRPGPVRLTVHSEYGVGRSGCQLIATTPPTDWLSAAALTMWQDFRDLFPGEYLSPDQSFALRNITLLFTDIKGSTEMYEALGDARAYGVVQAHFHTMTEIIRAHRGGVVKTIGDAVMAAFPVNADAVSAALALQRAFPGSDAPLDQVLVKIGLHRGPTIAVTSNRALDYFGRTVNQAARVQGAAEASEVLVTEPVLDDPAVTERLVADGRTPHPRRVDLKGIGTLTVHAL